MKKSIISILILFGMLLTSTYFVGEMLQSNLYKVLAHHSGMKMKLIHYEKSFFTAKMQVEITVPLEGESSLQLLTDSYIHHYPHKATRLTRISLLNPLLEQKLTTFFKTDEWLSVHEEINMLGKISGEVNVVKGEFNRQNESLQTEPLAISYQYDLNNSSGIFNLDWPGFDGDVNGTVFDMKNIQVNTSFSSKNKTDHIDYKYLAEIESISLKEPDKNSMTRDIWLKGYSKIGDDQLTLNSQNNLKVAEYLNGQKTFVDNQFNLSLSGLNLAALSILKSGNEDPVIIQQALNDLFKRGIHIDLNNLSSTTPWGEVKGQFNAELERGVNLIEVVNNPFNLIDYLNGELSISLPQKLLQQSDVGVFLQVGLENDLLEQKGGLLLLQSSLDRGELVINGSVIPM